MTLPLHLQPSLCALLAGVILSMAPAQGLTTGVPTTLNYQGRVLHDGVPYTGTGHFVFAMFSNTSVIWNNWQGREAGVTLDPSSEPDALKMINPLATPLPVEVRNGLFSAILGKGGDDNQPIDSGAFFDAASNPQRARPGMKLGVWFSQAADGPYARLDPDIQFASVPYAMVAAVADGVKDGSIQSGMLVRGLVLDKLRVNGELVQLSTYAVEPTLAEKGYARESARISQDGVNYYSYRYDPNPVYRLSLSTVGPDGLELSNGQSEPLDLGMVEDGPVAVVLEVRNIGNRPLTNLTVSISGSDSAEFSHDMGADDLPLAGAATLTVTGGARKRLADSQTATLLITANELTAGFSLQLTKGHPPGFVTIAAGPFTMGDSLDGMQNAPPVTIYLSEFQIAKTEVTWRDWQLVRAWALENDYTDLGVGAGKADNHPVTKISWFDVIKWCNARSEMENLEPVYITGGQVMRTGTQVPVPDWEAAGYRFPTEAEWEKAARGGLAGKRFPWGDTISHDQANVFISDQAYETGTDDFHPTWDGDGSYDNFPFTAPVASFQSNGFGVFDMAGNVREWCWDAYSSIYYGDAVRDPKGPKVLSDPQRVFRGGSWESGADSFSGPYRNDGRVAVRGSTQQVTYQFFDDIGFRPVRK